MWGGARAKIQARGRARSNHRHPVSKYCVDQRVWRGMWLALVLGSACSERGQGPAEPPITKHPPPCHLEAPLACRVGCDADVPRKIADAAPDLSGLDLAGLHGLVIAEILIDERGDVKAACLLRGVREDVDLRAMAAIRHGVSAGEICGTRRLEPDPSLSSSPSRSRSVGLPPALRRVSNAIARGPSFYPWPTRSGTSSTPLGIHDTPLRHTSGPSTDTEATHCESSRIV